MAIQLKVIQNTTFKQTTEDSSKLADPDKVAIAAGRILDIQSWKTVNPNYLRVALLSETLGDPARNTWYIYIPHVQLVQPPQIKVLQTTLLKQSTADSSQIPAADKVQVAAGTVFNLQSWATAPNSHLKLSLLWSTQGTPPRNTWYAYAPHMQFISQQPKVIPPPPPTPVLGGLPAAKQLNVPYKSQLDNVLNPSGACNVTSFAMVMAYFQIKGTTGSGQLEDELYQYMENQGLSRWDPNDLVTMSQNYGLVNDFTMRGSLSDIRKAIAEGRPCIIHGYFTSFGHIIVVRGYDRYGFYVNDPYGEWTSSGYRNELSGKNLYYSNSLIQAKCSPEGEDHIWVHRLAKRTALRAMTQSLSTGISNLWR
ncbi:MAG: C39 family peptidase [Kovacikia sp.]